MEASAAFVEVNGCLLVEVSREDASEFEKHFAQLAFSKVGQVTAEPVLKIAYDEIPIVDLVQAFNNPKHS